MSEKETQPFQPLEAKLQEDLEKYGLELREAQKKLQQVRQGQANMQEQAAVLVNQITQLNGAIFALNNILNPVPTPGPALVDETLKGEDNAEKTKETEGA